MSQEGDESLNCTELRSEIGRNEVSAEAFIKRDKKVMEENTVKGIGSAIPFLGILLVTSTDLSNKEQIEARALLDRNERLTFLYDKKNCKE